MAPGINIPDGLYPRLIAGESTTDSHDTVNFKVDPVTGGLITGGLSFTSTDNTTTTPLASGATYTGTAEQTNYTDVGVSCKTDNSGTLYFDFSNDGTNFDTFPVAGFQVASGIHEFHTAVKLGRYFRVRLVNDTGEQTYLRLYTYFGTFRQGNLPINASIASDADAMVVRSVSSEVDLALGRFGGMSVGSKFGSVQAIDAADNAVDIWEFSSDTASPRVDTKTFPTSSFTPYIASSSGSDTDVDVTVEYIDAEGLSQSVEVNTNGQTGVSLGVTALDVNRAYVSSTTAPVGNLYITTADNFSSGVPSTPSETVAFIPIGDNQTQQSQLTVPSNQTLIIRGINISVSRASGAAGSADITLRVKETGGLSRVKRRYFPTTEDSIKLQNQLITIQGGSQVVWRLDDVSDGDTNISCTWDYYLVDN